MNEEQAVVQRVAALTLPFDATITLPGSKSVANRALICACLARGSSVLKNATMCDDVAVMCGNLQRMGFGVGVFDWSSDILVEGGLPAAPAHTEEITLDCGDAGSVFRFLLALACIVPGRFVITGSPRLCERPIAPLVDALAQLGAEIKATAGRAPVHVVGGSLRGGSARLDASASSQFVSALELIAPAVPGGLAIELTAPPPSPGYVELTRQVMARFGVGKSADKYAGGGFEVESDWSAAGAFLVLARLSGSRIRFDNLAEDSVQPDAGLRAVLDQMARDGDEIVDARSLPDQVPNLVIYALFRRGRTTFKNAAHLRDKESDRLGKLVTELAPAGAEIRETQDGLEVEGGRPLHARMFATHDDHRLAMAFAVLGMVVSSPTQPVQVQNPGCVSKSYPSFWTDLESLRDTSRCIAIIGMRGAGKSTVGRELAQVLCRQFVDTDEVFVAEHGRISNFVWRQGWPEFRRREERIVADCLQAGRVVAVGGGAIESAVCRAVLQDTSVCVFLDPPIEVLERRLSADRVNAYERPSLTGAGIIDELRAVYERRRSQYLETATLTIQDPDAAPSEMASLVVQQLHGLCRAIRRR